MTSGHVMGTYSSQSLSTPTARSRMGLGGNGLPLAYIYTSQPGTHTGRHTLVHHACMHHADFLEVYQHCGVRAQDA